MPIDAVKNKGRIGKAFRLMKVIIRLGVGDVNDIGRSLLFLYF